MFLRILADLLPSRSNKSAQPRLEVNLEELSETANQLMESGDRHSALLAFRQVLALDPENVTAMNNLACCLADVGDMVEAAKLFAAAFSLNDTFLPAIVNHAKLLTDQKHSEEALPFIEQAKHAAPQYPYVDAVHGSLWFNRGDPELGRQSALVAWLHQFDNLRFANSYLWYSTYADKVGEATVAAEHVFWAETLRPFVPTPVKDGQTFPPAPAKVSNRIRIGYWSPDLRSHSVRYFFRPLLESHDRSRFEVFVYHDFPRQDAQTELIRSRADHFYDIGSAPDSQVVELMQSHDLDVLVELAGQSSTNRANLLQLRLARLQLSGIGYPPTTGLSSVDGKWLDPHTWTQDAEGYYAERPLVLPQSFWCFDPLEAGPEPGPPPSEFNGYITFGCTGNTAKITDEALRHWRSILDQVQGSRLRLQSINFEDDASRELMESRLRAAGFDLVDVDLLRPVGGDAFLKSYDAVDIILDTFPFNGGTTTAFALYMGAPVVSIFGNSLTSRMGLSMLSNMDAAHLATDNWDDYVRIAVATASNSDFLNAFRQSARSRFTSTALGNGALFTRDFEATCLAALKEESLREPYRHQVRALPANELARRAHHVLSTGQFEAAQRIALHCLQHHPHCGAAHIIRSQSFLREKDYAGATRYLETCLSDLSIGDAPAVLVNLLRLDTYRGDVAMAESRWQTLASLPLTDPLDLAHLHLYEAQLATSTHDDTTPLLTASPSRQPIRCTIVMVADDDAHLTALEEHIRSVTASSSIDDLTFVRSSEREKLTAYQQALQDTRSDFAVLLQSNVIPQHPRFLDRIADALESSDLVASSGCRVWRQLDWRADEFEQKVGATLWSSSDADGFIEITHWSTPESAIASGLAVLDGKLLAARTGSLKFAELDGRLMGYDTLMEEAWSHECFRNGARLSVHQGLGIHVGSANPLTEYNRSDACWTVAETYAFPAFHAARTDRSIVGAPCADVATALKTLDALQDQIYAQ